MTQAALELRAMPQHHCFKEPASGPRLRVFDAVGSFANELINPHLAQPLNR
jgi:hypothetical protein